MPQGYGRPALPSDPERYPWTRVREALATAHNYWIGTTCPDGRPHTMPVWGLWLDETFWFSTDPRSRKGRNLAANPAINVHLESGNDAVILEGIAARAISAVSLARFADAYEVKYRFRPDPERPEHGVYVVQPRVVFAWQESDFAESATRWLFGDT